MIGCSPLRTGSSGAANQNTMKNPYAPPQKEEGFFEKLFKPKEPEKPKSVNDWMKTTKPVLPDTKT